MGTITRCNKCDCGGDEVLALILRMIDGPPPTVDVSWVGEIGPRASPASGLESVSAMETGVTGHSTVQDDSVPGIHLST